MDKKVHAAFALFDYSPESTDQLELKKGDKLTIIGNINSVDGWVKAILNDKEGLVSIHYIKMVDKYKNTIKLKKRKIRKTAVTTESTKAKKAIALFDFVPPHDREDILAFKKNDIIEMKSKKHVGWWNGILNGKKGLVPIKYIKFLDEEEGKSSTNEEDDENEEKNAKKGKENDEKEKKSEENNDENNEENNGDEEYQFFTENTNVDLFEVQKILGTPSNSDSEGDEEDEEEEEEEDKNENDVKEGKENGENKVTEGDQKKSISNEKTNKSEPLKRRTNSKDKKRRSKNSNTTEFDSFPTIQSIQSNNTMHLKMLKKQNNLFQKNLPFLKQIKKGDSHLFISNTDMSSGLFSTVPKKPELVYFYTDLISNILKSAGYLTEEYEQIMNLVKSKTNHHVTLSKATRDIVKIFFFFFFHS